MSMIERERDNRDNREIDLLPSKECHCLWNSLLRTFAKTCFLTSDFTLVFRPFLCTQSLHTWQVGFYNQIAVFKFSSNEPSRCWGASHSTVEQLVDYWKMEKKKVVRVSNEMKKMWNIVNHSFAQVFSVKASNNDTHFVAIDGCWLCLIIKHLIKFQLRTPENTLSSKCCLSMNSTFLWRLIHIQIKHLTNEVSFSATFEQYVTVFFWHF